MINYIPTPIATSQHEYTIVAYIIANYVCSNIMISELFPFECPSINATLSKTKSQYQNEYFDTKYPTVGGGTKINKKMGIWNLYCESRN